MMNDSHTITLDESQRQHTLLALAVLARKRPGWNLMLSQTALLLDTKREDGKPAMFEDFKKFNSGPVKLEWVWHAEKLSFIARVPASDYVGDGHLVIHAIPRPGYCDRGKYHVLVESDGVGTLDDQEGFPRYYFKLENLQEEMETWANERESVKAALKK